VSTVQKLALSLVLLFTGLLAGLQFLMLVGVLPAIARVPLLTYAVTWQALDHFMSGRMPILANATLLLYLISIGIFARFRPKWILWSLLGAFALLVMDTAFTITQQLPVNRAVQALDVAHLADAANLQSLRDATIRHFHLRGWFSITAFVWLVFGVVFSLGGQPVDDSKGIQL
jgi:uncharacterized membrane protein